MQILYNLIRDSVIYYELSLIQIYCILCLIYHVLSPFYFQAMHASIPFTCSFITN